MNWMLLPLRRFFDFRGRSRRKEFWMFVLFLLLASMFLPLVDSLLGLGGSSATYRQVGSHEVAMGYGLSGGLLTGLFGFAMIVPGLAVSVRRLHDTDKSGWWLLIGLIPLIGGLFLLYHYVQPGTHGPNRFGPDPLAEDGASAA
jgi:uncharacterized membrane protein YhaH (DUF805 family)